MDMLLLTKTSWTTDDILKAPFVSLIVTMITGEMEVAVAIVPLLAGVQIDPLVDSVSYLLLLLLSVFFFFGYICFFFFASILAQILRIFPQEVKQLTLP